MDYAVHHWGAALNSLKSWSTRDEVALQEMRSARSPWSVIAKATGSCASIVRRPICDAEEAGGEVSQERRTARLGLFIPIELRRQFSGN